MPHYPELLEVDGKPVSICTRCGVKITKRNENSECKAEFSGA